VARARRNKSYKLAQIYDRRSREVPFNAEVAEVEVDNPLALDSGEKILAIRSIRSDPLGRLHAHHQIDEAQYRGGRAFQNDWERAERGPQAVDTTREYVDGAGTREPVTESQRQAVLRLNRAERARHRWRRAGARRAGAWSDHGSDRATSRRPHAALERLFCAAFSRMPGSAGVGLRLRDGDGNAASGPA